MNQKNISHFIGLMNHALGGTHFEPDNVNWNQVINLALSHHVEVIIYEAISSLSKDLQPPKSLVGRLEEMVLTLVTKDANQISEVEGLLREFDKKALPAITLKGWVMKDLYPRTDYRYMADTDIFIRSGDEKTIHNIIMNHDFISNGLGDKKDNVYFKQFITLEIHKNLFKYEDEWNEQINNPNSQLYIWNRVEKLDGYSHIYKMDVDYYYVYHLAHMVKHLISGGGGIGVKSIMDVWVYRFANSRKLNFERISDDLDLLGLTDFEKTVWSLAKAWFSDNEIVYPNDSIRQFGEYIIDCGAYGHSDNFVANNEAMRDAKKPTRIGYIARRAFPSKSSMEKRFPKIKTHPVTLPYYWIKRLWRDGVRRKKEVMGEVSSAWNVDYDKIESIHSLYREWGVPRAEEV